MIVKQLTQSDGDKNTVCRGFLLEFAPNPQATKDYFMPVDASNLIWIDLEMTGLDTQSDQIIEMATIITDANLITLAEGPVIAIHQPQEVLDAMDEWNQTQHGDSGLIERVRDSAYNEAKAEAETLDFLRRYVPEGASPMCGNSICQDRRFLARGMPRLEAYFHYRNLDVSTLKELAMRWAPSLMENFKKTSKHLALDDVRDSIAELKHYRDHFLRLP
jgi:oligoribonuclease